MKSSSTSVAIDPNTILVRDYSLEHKQCCNIIAIIVVVVVVVFTLKAVPVSTQYFLASVLVQLTRTPSVVTG